MRPARWYEKCRPGLEHHVSCPRTRLTFEQQIKSGHICQSRVRATDRRTVRLWPLGVDLAVPQAASLAAVTAAVAARAEAQPLARWPERHALAAGELVEEAGRLVEVKVGGGALGGEVQRVARLPRLAQAGGREQPLQEAAPVWRPGRV